MPRGRSWRKADIGSAAMSEKCCEATSLFLKWRRPQRQSILDPQIPSREQLAVLYRDQRRAHPARGADKEDRAAA